MFLSILYLNSSVYFGVGSFVEQENFGTLYLRSIDNVNKITKHTDEILFFELI